MSELDIARANGQLDDLMTEINQQRGAQTMTTKPCRQSIPHLVMCPTCDKEYEPRTGKPAPEPYGTGVRRVTYQMCLDCMLRRRDSSKI